MKGILTVFITIILFSCATKNYYTAGEEVKLKFDRELKGRVSSKNKYEVIVKDFISGKEKVHQLPANALWERKMVIPEIKNHYGNCVVFPEQPGPKDLFIREMLCSGTAALVDFKNIVVCGQKINYDSETIRIFYNDDLKYTVQLRCFY